MDATILSILVKHNLTPTAAQMAAMRDAFQAGAASNVSNEDDGPAGLSSEDVKNLTALGIDPHKKFQLRNSTFTIIGFRPSRWKFPISAKTQNGTGYKFTIAQIKSYQGR